MNSRYLRIYRIQIYSIYSCMPHLPVTSALKILFNLLGRKNYKRLQTNFVILNFNNNLLQYLESNTSFIETEKYSSNDHRCQLMFYSAKHFDGCLQLSNPNVHTRF